MRKSADLAAPLKRRSFVGAAAALATGIFAGPGWVARLVHPSGNPLPGQKKMSISINPLAVPRRRKGADTNG
jgi:hypothetical protein